MFVLVDENGNLIENAKIGKVEIVSVPGELPYANIKFILVETPGCDHLMSKFNAESGKVEFEIKGSHLRGVLNKEGGDD